MKTDLVFFPETTPKNTKRVKASTNTKLSQKNYDAKDIARAGIYGFVAGALLVALRVACKATIVMSNS